MWCGRLHRKLAFCSISWGNKAVVPISRNSATSCEVDEAPLPFSAMPGPKPLPLIGNSLELMKNMENLRLYFQEGFNKFGDIYRVKGAGDYMVLVKDPSIIERVLRAEGKYPIRDTTFSPNIVWLYKNRLKAAPSIVFQEGKSWKETRTAMGKQIMPRNVQMWHNCYNGIIHRFTRYIKSSMDPNGTMQDISYPIKRLLIELSVMTTFGSDWNVVANPTEKEEEFIAAVSRFIGLVFRLSFELPLYKLYDNKLSRDFKAAYKVIENHSKAEAERILALVKAGKESSTPGLLEQWLREGNLSEEAALNEAIQTFPAGVDTTANQATFLLHAIAMNEDVQERLHDEIKTTLGSNKLPLPEHLSKMPFMKGCLLESYRLHGTVTLVPRVLTQDAVFHGYQVPANTTVTYALYSAGRDESLFPDPLKFDPERWKRDDTHAFAIQPFGFGPRSCYGRRFAELELKLLLIQMVYNFKLSTEKDIEVVERSVVSPRGDVTIRFTDRKLTN